MVTSQSRSIRSGRLRRPSGPVAVSVFGLILFALTVGLLVFALHLRSAGAQSAYTQAHGVYRQATVVSVQNVQHQSSSRSGSRLGSYTAQVSATLNPPVGGQSQTTVNVPRAVSYATGQTVWVLIDPRAPGYAELPGEPEVTQKGWLVPMAAAGVCALLTCFLAWRAILAFHRRRFA